MKTSAKFIVIRYIRQLWVYCAHASWECCTARHHCPVTHGTRSVARTTVKHRANLHQLHFLVAGISSNNWWVSGTTPFTFLLSRCMSADLISKLCSVGVPKQAPSSSSGARPSIDSSSATQQLRRRRAVKQRQQWEALAVSRQSQSW